MVKVRNLIAENPAISVNLQNKILKHVDAALKKTKPNKENKDGNKIVGTSQFDKKMNVSDEMIEFAGWEAGSVHSRVEVTTAIWKYIKENNLRRESNKRISALDSKLKQLFKVDLEELKYPQIQKYIGQHLTKIENP